jgi:hypothetical protein
MLDSLWLFVDLLDKVLFCKMISFVHSSPPSSHNFSKVKVIIVIELTSS